MCLGPQQDFWLTSHAFRVLATKTREIWFVLKKPNAFHTHVSLDQVPQAEAPYRYIHGHRVSSSETLSGVDLTHARLHGRLPLADFLLCGALRSHREAHRPAFAASTDPTESPVGTPPMVDARMGM